MRYDPDKINGAIDKNRAHTMDSKNIYDGLRHHVKEYLSLDWCYGMFNEAQSTNWYARWSKWCIVVILLFITKNDIAMWIGY